MSHRHSNSNDCKQRCAVCLKLSLLKNAYSHPPFGIFWGGILTHKVGHTELVFGVTSGLISRSVQTNLQVFACSGYDLCHSG